MKQAEVKAGFEKWSAFEKAKKANRMRHLEVSEALRDVISERFSQSPRILDVGCGDTEDISQILEATIPSEYIGIDNSPQVLNSARIYLRERLSCKWHLICTDYTEALNSIHPPLDIIWLGLFLHHLSLEQKWTFFQHASMLLTSGGAILCHDPVLLETEDRSDFLKRISLASQNWQELTPDEKEILERHCSMHGHQERISTLEKIAIGSGFSQMEVLWLDPDKFYALMAFWI